MTKNEIINKLSGWIWSDTACEAAETDDAVASVQSKWTRSVAARCSKDDLMHCLTVKVLAETDELLALIETVAS